MKSRKANDFIAKYICATPLLLDFEGYKSTHLLHHRHLMSESDPDWVSQEKEYEYSFPKNDFQFFYIFIRDVTGLGTYRLFQAIFHYSKEDEVKKKDKRFNLQGYLTPLIFVLVAIIFYTTGFIAEFFMYWIVPVFTWRKWISYLRAIGEHHGLSYDMQDEKTKSRTTLVGWIGKIFITPHNANYHTEHHLYPSIPFYNLPKLHQILRNDDIYRANTTLTHGYFDVIRECLNAK